LDELGGLRALGRLKLIGVGAPIVFLVGFEAFRLVVIDAAFTGTAATLVAVGLAVLAALAFGLVLFFHIERAQQQIVRRNRDLAIVNAVSVAIQGEVDEDQVLHAALKGLLDVTGAAEVAVVLRQGDSGEPAEREILLRAEDAPRTDALTAPDRCLEVPLATSSAALGRLRLRVPADRAGQLPSAEALQTLGRELAAALQIGRLVGDLQRRKTEGHTLYQALLEISNQAPLAQILDTIATGARDRLAAEESCVCLTDPVLHDFAGDAALVDGFGHGAECGAPGSAETEGQARTHQCRIAGSPAHSASMTVPIWSQGELLGDLWVARGPGDAFTERDRSTLSTLAGLAAIAITAARLREHERQGAILAERDRIARELHDSLAQVLGSTHLRLRGLLARPDLADRPRVAAELTELAEVAEEAYRDVREAILGLREASRRRGLLESLEAFLEKYSLQSGVKTHLETDITAEPDLPTNSEIQLIRVIQEALTNVRKHARAKTARVRIKSGEDGGGLTIVIEDDGRGFDPTTTTVHRDGGYGLQTMRERIELVGGTLRVDSAVGRGTRVIAIVPEATRPATREAPARAEDRP